MINYNMAPLSPKEERETTVLQLLMSFVIMTSPRGLVKVIYIAETQRLLF